MTTPLEDKPRRGRPPTGRAKTGAERQRAYLARLKSQGSTTVTTVSNGIDLPPKALKALERCAAYRRTFPETLLQKLIEAEEQGILDSLSKPKESAAERQAQYFAMTTHTVSDEILIG